MNQPRKGRLLALSFYTNKSGDITDRIFTKNALGSAASQRIQLIPALQVSKEIGYEINVKSLHSNRPEQVTNLEKYDICLIGKMSANSSELTQSMIVANLAAITKTKLLGSKIALLYCDNLLIDKTALGEFYKLIFKLADYLIYPTNYLQKIGSKYCSKQASSFVINDPWQINQLHNPRPKTDSEPWKIIWFGSNKNFIYLHKLLPKPQPFHAKSTAFCFNWELGIE